MERANPTDTHFYDGQLISIKFPDVNIEDKREAFEQFRSKLTSVAAQKCVDLILKDTERNYDHTNTMYADDLLYHILENNNDESSCIFDLLQEQLADVVMSGQCPQGRVIRLYQIYLLLD